MTDFKIHDETTAPPRARLVLQNLRDGLGFIPNVHAVIANSGTATQAMSALQSAVSNGSFDATEQQIIQIATSAVNGCSYCVAGHTAFAEMQGLPRDVIQAARDERPIDDKKLEALRCFTAELVARRGHVAKEDIDRFLGAGYSRPQIIELIVAVATKTISNYVSTCAKIPLDEAFVKHAWQAPTRDTDTPNTISNAA